MGSGKPLVLLDVDGVLNPFRRPHRGYRRFRVAWGGYVYRLWLDAGHGAQLLALAEETGSELAWASYWCAQANVSIGPRVGLPELAYVPIPRFPGVPDGVSLGAWKARHVARYVGERPFVWFEDEPDAAERLLDHLATGSHLLIHVDPVHGLREEHLDRARAWLETLDQNA